MLCTAIVAALFLNFVLLRSEAETILTNVDFGEIDKKVKEQVQAMTMDEKMLFMHGDKEGLKYDGPPAIPRLKIPSYIIAHGPYGARATFRDEDGKSNLKPGTFMSCTINYAATWDPELIQKVTAGIGAEVRCAGDHSLAGPALNIIRDLRDGRSAEYFTEDPYLNERSTVAFVKGLSLIHI